MTESSANSSASDFHLSDSFMLMAEGLGDFVCLATSHGEPFYLNPAGRRMLGLAEEQEVATTSLHDYYDPESWEQLRDTAVPAVNKTGQWKGSCRLRNLQSGAVYRCPNHHAAGEIARRQSAHYLGYYPS